MLATKLIRTRNLILENNEKGYYFDFDNGFMVASFDYEIYLISNNDLPYENDLFLSNNEIYFNGSSFRNEDGFEYVISNNQITNENVLDARNQSKSPSINLEDGEIKYSDIYKYISSNYSGFNIVSENYIKSYDYISQFDTSIYIKRNNGYDYSEGNCVLNATYSMLHNLGKKNRDRNFYYKDFYVNYNGEHLINDDHYYLTNYD